MQDKSSVQPIIEADELRQAIEAIATLCAAGSRSPADVMVLQRAFEDAAAAVAPQTVFPQTVSPGTAKSGPARARIGIDAVDGRMLKIIFDPPMGGPRKCPHCEKDIP